MCGLIGFSGATNFNPSHIKLLMVLNAIDRGADATGFYTPQQGLVKSAEHAKVFLPKNTIQATDIFLGHVRAKTVGLNIDANAHPFSYENVVLAHNGTLVNHFELISNAGLNRNDFDVDSQCVAGLLNKSMGSCDYNNFDPLEYFKPITEIDGAAAFLFKDKRDLEEGRTSRIFAYRNTERPLHYGFDENNNMYISSIEAPLVVAGLSDIKQFEPNIVYEIENGEILSEMSIPRYTAATSASTNVLKIFNDLTKGLFSTNFYDLEQIYLPFDLDAQQCKRYGFKSLTKGKFYFVTDIISSPEFDNKIITDVVILNDANQKVEVPIYAFDLRYVDYSYTKYAKVLTPISNTPKEGPKFSLSEIGDIVEVITKPTYLSKKVNFRYVDIKPTKQIPNVLPDDCFAYKTSWLRPLTVEELIVFNKNRQTKEPKINTKVIKKEQNKRVPSAILKFREHLKLNIADKADLALSIDPELANITLDLADYLQSLVSIKEELDDFTMMLLKVLEKRKNQTDHNLYSFDDIKDSISRIYNVIEDCTDLNSLQEVIKKV